MRLVGPVWSAHASHDSHVASASTLTRTCTQARSRGPVRATRSLHLRMPSILTVLTPPMGVIRESRQLGAAGAYSPGRPVRYTSARWFRDAQLNNWKLHK